MKVGLRVREKMEKIQQNSCFFPDEILLNIFSRLCIKDLVSARLISKRILELLSSYHFSTLRKLVICSKILLVSEDTVLFLDLNQPKDFVVDTQHVRSPPLITVAAQEYPDQYLSSTLEFHGSVLGLVCLSVKHSYFVWNPNTGSCLEFPKPEFTTLELFSGIGDVGSGAIEIVRVAEMKNLKAVFGVPMVIDCLCTDNKQWTNLNLSASFLGPSPVFVGVAQNVMVWAYPDINTTFMSGYHFPSRTVIELTEPPQTSLPRHTCRLFVAADTIFAVGEAAADEVNYLWRLEGDVREGRWKRERDLTMFLFRDYCGLVEKIIGSTPDFRKLLVLNNFDYLLILHLGAHGDELDLTFVDQDQRDVDDSMAKSVITVADTYHFDDLCSIQFHETIFWPWPCHRKPSGRAAQAAERFGALTQEHADSDHLEFLGDQESC